MAERETDLTHSFFVLPDEPLIGVPVRHNGHEATRFFTSEAEADGVLSRDEDGALRLAGSWQDLPWQEVEEALDQNRHATPPSPPLEV